MPPFTNGDRASTRERGRISAGLALLETTLAEAGIGKPVVIALGSSEAMDQLARVLGVEKRGGALWLRDIRFVFLKELL